MLATLSENDIITLVDGLNTELCDNLMKYVFKLMGANRKTVSCGTLLKLHAQLVEKAGLGCIVRSMTDRKTV